MNIFSDSTLGLELEKIKEQVAKLYNQMILKAYKASNPAATEEDIAAFLEENKLDFEDYEEPSDELDELSEIVESLIDGDDLDLVKDKNYTNPDVETGSEMTAKSKSFTTTPDTKNLEIQTGMLSRATTREEVKTSKLPEHEGKQKRSATHEQVDFTDIKPVFKKIQESLKDLKQRQNICVNKFRELL